MRTNSTRASAKGEKDGKEQSSYYRRARFALTENVQKACMESPGRVYLLTLTCGFFRLGKFIKFRHPKSVSKRWNSLRPKIMAWLGVERGIVVPEKHKDGTWHLHIFLVLSRDLAPNWSWETYDRARNAGRNGKTNISRALYSHLAKTNPDLGRKWALLRKRLHAYGFGRCELVPVRHVLRAGNYLGKYLGKGQCNRGRVQTRYIGDWMPQADRAAMGYILPRGWSWATPGGAMHRCLVGAMATMIGQTPETYDPSRFSIVWGKSWCFKLWQAFSSDATHEGGLLGYLIERGKSGIHCRSGVNYASVRVDSGGF